MSELTSITGRMFQHAKEYIDVKVDLFKLDAVERNAKLASGLVAAVIIGIIGIFTLLMLSMAAAFWLGSIWGAWYWGFLAVGGGYLVIFVLVYLNRNRWIREPVHDSIVDQYFEKQDDETKEQHEQAAA
jgi:hypothetical protein